MLESYMISRTLGSANPREQMRYEKQKQISYLYDLATDREDDVKLNGKYFKLSPRIFDRKFVDSTHHKITVETITDEDWMECGDYLEYDGMMWLCLNSYSFHKMYCKATFMSCDWKLYWQNKSGEIKSAYVIDQNSTQYNSGESGNDKIQIGAAQHMIRVQCNPDTLIFDTPMRFAMDKNIENPTCYKVTQNDNTAYNYGKGLCMITVMEDVLNRDTDKYVKLPDGNHIWICNYFESNNVIIPDNEPEPEIPSIFMDGKLSISGKNEIKWKIPRKYKATIKLPNDDETALSYKNISWNVISDFEVEMEQSGEYGEEITLLTSDENSIGETITLQLLINGEAKLEKELLVIEGF
ncbi:hypothetical protein DW272_01600 [Blautia obeum]|uniref:Uncharacterized protein n=1 Tax=Blautia obeum TaxID=40520 RepID=A0A414SK13_9FIRM|nr:hypothetical protein [Blautia obeum]RHG19928.1 hypothetical protein DW272_01600 [Blautia obeum]